MENKTFLDDLPKWGNGKNDGQINWTQSINNIVKVLYNNKEYNIIIKDYNCNTQNLTIQYLNNPYYIIKTGHFSDCQMGNYLGDRTIHHNKINDIITTKNGKIKITKCYRETNKNGRVSKWYKYTCLICGWDEGKITEGGLTSGSGCSCCNGKTIIKGINTIYDLEPWMIPFVGEEIAKTHTPCSNEKIYPICPDCGRIKTKAISINYIYYHHSMSCSCGDGFSYPNKFCFSLLEQLGVVFETEKLFDWCRYTIKNKIKKGIFDFYIKMNNREYVIEMDGGFHQINNNMNNQTVKDSKLIDNNKDNLAKEHNIDITRVDCSKSNLEFIKINILNSKLSNIFNLSNINWSKCEEFALNNLCKQVCEIKRNKPDIITSDIATIMKLDRATICTYLKKGNILGWCHYDANEEKLKGSVKSGKLRGKKVEVFNEKGENIGTFESARDVERQSEKLFGIKLNYKGISAVCLGKFKYHKHFSFKFTL